MNSVIGLWSLKVSPSAKGVEFEAETDIKITNVALGDDEETPNKTGRSTVKLVYQNPSWDNEEQGPAHEPEIATTICSLTCGKVEQISTDIVIPQDGIYKFIVTGQNTVYITGQRIHQASMGGLDSDSESSIDSEEEAYRLQDVSSDVEIDAADLDSDADRFEEIDSDAEAGKPKQLKRPRESMDVDGADAPAKLSKADKKKQKKQKGEDGKAVEDKVAPTPEKKDKKEKASKGETKELPSGLRITDSKVGTGPQAKKGQRIEMRYIGKLQNGKIFDQNTKGKPFAFRLGNGEVIKGWDEGIAGMQVGGERLLVIPPGLAYGKKGSPPQIPGNSTLTFECKLVSVK